MLSPFSYGVPSFHFETPRGSYCPLSGTTPAIRKTLRRYSHYSSSPENPSCYISLPTLPSSLYSTGLPDNSRSHPPPHSPLACSIREVSSANTAMSHKDKNTLSYFHTSIPPPSDRFVAYAHITKSYNLSVASISTGLTGILSVRET